MVPLIGQPVNALLACGDQPLLEVHPVQVGMMTGGIPPGTQVVHGTHVSSVVMVQGAELLIVVIDQRITGGSAVAGEGQSVVVGAVGNLEAAVGGVDPVVGVK